MKEWDWDIFAFDQEVQLSVLEFISASCCMLFPAPNKQQELIPVLVQVFSYFNFFDQFGIPVSHDVSMDSLDSRSQMPVLILCLDSLCLAQNDAFIQFAKVVRKNYLDMPFHNFYHAVDCLQSVFCLLVTYGAEHCLTPVERFSILIAALCHDIRHPGLNNTYQVNAQTPLALLYNDQAVLEHHHCASTFRCGTRTFPLL